jgi:hypothetical protein
MLKVKKVMNCSINKNGTLEGSEHANSRRLLGIFFFFFFDISATLTSGPKVVMAH